MRIDHLMLMWLTSATAVAAAAAADDAARARIFPCARHWSVEGVRLGRACSGIGRLLGLQAAAPDSTGINGVVAPHAGVMMHLVGGGRGLDFLNSIDSAVVAQRANAALASLGSHAIAGAQGFRNMPLALQALPDCRSSSSSSSLLNSGPGVSAHSRRPQGRVQCGASPLPPSNFLANLPLSSFSCARLLARHGAVDRGVPRCRRLNGSSDVEGRGELALGLQNVDLGRGEMLKVAVVAGLVALQSCLPAFAESLGVEVARSSGSTGLITDWSDFQSGFSSAFLLIFFSEIGDKTFFIAALLATRKSNLAVFAGTFGALAAMTVISVALGRAFHYLDNFIPSFGTGQFPWDDLAAVVLLVYFGVSTLVDAASMEGSKAEEEKQDAELAIAGVAGDSNVGLQATVAATFALVFVAEWGDKSFFSTIALAAASSPAGVVTGAIAGHGVATVLAVLGGSFLSEFISEKLIAYIGGVLFLVFAATTLVDILK